MASTASKVKVTIMPGVESVITLADQVMRRIKEKFVHYGVEANDLPWFKFTSPCIGEAGALNVQTLEMTRFGFEKSIFQSKRLHKNKRGSTA